jgi:hypothetical protein
LQVLEGSQHVPDVGVTNDVTPVVTRSVNALNERYAAALAEIVLFDGDAFERVYVDFALEVQSDCHRMVDERLEMTNSAVVRDHLIESRRTIMAHAERARVLKGELTTTASR